MSLQPTKEGTIPFLVPGANKECFTYYKIFGSLTSGKTPCVLLHGGPGLSHDYMLSCLPLFSQFETPLVLYDQLGNGLSTHLQEKKGDEEFWTEDLFHRELENLLHKLELDVRGFDLLGHSWGGMMGSTFAGKRPKGLRKLILTNSPASIQLWIDAYMAYRKRLPQEMQNVLQKHEDAGTEESEEYQNIMVNEFFKRHMCSVTPWPEDFMRSFKWAEEDGTVASTMSGTSEWKVTGSNKDWSAVERVKTINVPTLVINGKDEGASDEAVKPFVDEIKDVKWVKLEKSSHMPMYEDPDKYFGVLVEFLTDL